jgi:hypothetical protein
METHFLAEIIGTEPTFVPEPWYNGDGDSLIYKLADEATVADRIDDLLTIYRSAVDNRPIGFQIKGVAATIRRLGLAGLAVSSEADESTVAGVSIAALMLAAYETGEPTIVRRNGYATAMECEVPKDKRRISSAELQLA